MCLRVCDCVSSVDYSNCKTADHILVRVLQEPLSQSLKEYRWFHRLIFQTVMQQSHEYSTNLWTRSRLRQCSTIRKVAGPVVHSGSNRNEHQDFFPRYECGGEKQTVLRVDNLTTFVCFREIREPQAPTILGPVQGYNVFPLLL